MINKGRAITWNQTVADGYKKRSRRTCTQKTHSNWQLIAGLRWEKDVFK